MRIMKQTHVSNRNRKLFVILGLSLFSAIFSLAGITRVSAQIWEDFTVWYDGNGADSGHIYEVLYKSGANDVTLKENTASVSDTPYVKNGCTFIGWSLEPENDSAISPILPGGSVWDPVDVPVTWIENRSGFVFYACWECDPNFKPTALPPTATATRIPATATSIPTARPTQTTQPTAAATQQLLIAPQSSAQPTKTAVPVPQGATATPSLLIYPNSRTSLIGKDGEGLETGETGQDALLIAPAKQNGFTLTNSVQFPVLFNADNENLTALPETGITSHTGVSRSMKPGSVNYIPTLMELQIPSLNINSNIVTVNSDESGYPIQWLEMNTGLLAGSSLPGDGYSILVAHNTLDAETFGPFALIKALRLGDRIFVRTNQNQLMIFEVYANEKINEYDYEALYQIGALYENSMTLLTCEDERMEGGYINRRIISARPIN